MSIMVCELLIQEMVCPLNPEISPSCQMNYVDEEEGSLVLHQQVGKWRNYGCNSLVILLCYHGRVCKGTE